MKSKFDIEYKESLFLNLHLPESDEFDVFVYFRIFKHFLTLIYWNFYSSAIHNG